MLIQMLFQQMPSIYCYSEFMQITMIVIFNL